MKKFNRDDGDLTQLNTCLLQIENEFYSTIRPKREVPSGSRPIKVLMEQGVEYIEVRCLDLNPFLPVGIEREEMHFLNSFLIFCLLRNSPPSNREEYQEIDANLKAVVNRGRDPDLLLRQKGQAIHMRDWAREILGEAMEIAELLDSISESGDHTEATRNQLRKVENAELTPSARVLQRMRESKASFARFALDQSLACSDYFRGRRLSDELVEEFDRLAEQSEIARLAAEQTNDMDFPSYLKHMNES